MVLEKIKERIIEGSSTLIQALKLMDEKGVKLLFVFENNKFLGILTIGDIQRAIIKNIDINSNILSILDKNKIYATPSDSIETIKSKMYKLRSECMPLVSDGS